MTYLDSQLDGGGEPLLLDISDDEMSYEMPFVMLSQFPEELLPGLREVVAGARSGRIGFEYPEWELKSMLLDGTTMTQERMPVDTPLYLNRTLADTEMVPVPNHQNNNNRNRGEHSLVWKVALLPVVDLPPGTLQCRVVAVAGAGAELHLAVGYRGDERNLAFRAIGRLLTLAQSIRRRRVAWSPVVVAQFTEQRQFDTLCLMLECSRNAVLRVAQVEQLLRWSALLGINSCMLYTEDTYEMPGEPFFGYLRGRYTTEDLQHIHACAEKYGIEMIPCIQTLGHLGQVLQWPAYAAYRDTSEVLLAHADETYAFIDRMLSASTAGGPCRRIHIGMDETFGVGEGKHRSLFGNMDARRLFSDHLERVMALCHARGIEPLIWSDMLFTLASNGSGASTGNSTVASAEQDGGPALIGSRPTSDEAYPSMHRDGVQPSQTPRLPNGPLQLVYWDYYHTDPAAYRQRIREHRVLMHGQVPWVATGIWNWNRPWTATEFTLRAVGACMQACRQEGIRHVMVTTWGDDGNECDTLSVLPGLHYYAAHGFTEDGREVDLQQVKDSFAALCGGHFDDWCDAGQLDIIPGAEKPGQTLLNGTAQYPGNPSKWMLWDDPLYSMFSPQYAGLPVAEHFHRLAERLSYAARRPGYPLNERLHFPAAIARVLHYKVDLRDQLVAAYRLHREQDAQQGTTQLRAVVATRLQPLRRELDTLWRLHRNLWLELNRAFGWEVLEMRYATVRTRLESLEERLADYLTAATTRDRLSNTPALRLEELEVSLERIQPEALTQLALYHSRLVTPSRSLGTG